VVVPVFGPAVDPKASIQRLACESTVILYTSYYRNHHQPPEHGLQNPFLFLAFLMSGTFSMLERKLWQFLSCALWPYNGATQGLSLTS
jgi:hypothetical protein